MRLTFFTRFVWLLIIVFSNNAVAQVTPDTMRRYVSAAKYLRTNENELNEKWMGLFKGGEKKLYKSRIGKEFKYKISPMICFLPILIFKDEVGKLDSITHHSRVEIEEPSVYNGRYLFNSFISEYLFENKLADTNEVVLPNTFIVNFSKPINNYLIAEITMNPKRLNQCDVKVLGRTMWMIFIFLADESLNKVYYSYYDR